MTNFVYDDTALYADKTNLRAVRNATTEWSAEDTALIKAALQDTRTALKAGLVLPYNYGVVGDGVADDTAALQDAIDDTQGRTLYLPKGKYKTSSTLLITDRCHRIVGDYGNRFADGGTEISFSGLGPAIQFGTDNLLDWNANDDSGPQDQLLENLWISHSAPDTVLTGAGTVGPHFKAQAYGIWDWRGGQVVLKNVGIEKFEANYAGIRSDITELNFVVSLYSKYGIYVGPRSDQFTINRQYSFFCDRAITVDGASCTRVVDGQFVACGTSTVAPIEVRRGSASVVIERPWFEHVTGQGYQGTDQLAFVSVGEVDGYGSGGSIQSAGGSPNTATVEGCAVSNPLIYTVVAATAAHTKYIAAVGKCHMFTLHHPMAKAGNNLSNLDAMVGIQATQTPSASDTQIEITGVESSTTLAKMYANNGAGTPAVAIRAGGSSGVKTYSASTHRFFKIGAPTGSEEFRIGQNDVAGTLLIEAPTYATGQTTRLWTTRAIQPGNKAAAPSSGTWERGDRVLIQDPSEGDYGEWLCTVAGSPGTWRKTGLVTSANGFALSDHLTVGKSMRMTELVAAQITSNQNDYNPGGSSAFADATVVLLTSDAARDITGFGNPANSKMVEIYNNGAQNITLKHQSASSSAANRIIGTAGADVVLTPNRGCRIFYSPSTTRWLVMTDNL